MAYVIKHNDPSPGYVSWSNMNMAYNGNTYAIADGNSNMIFIYWLLSSPYVMQTSNTFPTLAHTDVVVILNKSGTALLVPGSTILDGSLIVPGTILADALSANSVTSAKILAGSIQSTHISTGAIVADSIAAGAIGTAAIAAGAVISDHILADNVLAGHIVAGAIQAGHVAAGAIATNHLAAEAVTAAKIQALTITGAKIAADAITAAKIKAGEITTNHIHVDGLNANVIKTGTLDAARVRIGATSSYDANYDPTTKATPAYVQSRGENLVTNGSALLGDNTNFSSFIFDGSQAYYSGGSFRYYSAGTILTNEFIPVNPELRYLLGMFAKTLGGAGRYYVFVGCYDVDNLSVNANHHVYRANTLTTLALELKNNDTVVYLTDASNWNNSGTAGVNTHLRSIILWNYVNSFGYLYPPQTYSRNWTGNAWDPGAIDFVANTITLRVPWAGGTIPAGTHLSNGSSGATYKYLAMINTLVPTTWTHYSGIMSGVDLTGTNVGGKFPPGTAKTKIGWLMNYGGTGETIWIANLSFAIDVETTAGAQTKANTAETSAKNYGDTILKSMADGTYAGGTFIDGKTVTSPTVVGMQGSFLGLTAGNPTGARLELGRVVGPPEAPYLNMYDANGLRVKFTQDSTLYYYKVATVDTLIGSIKASVVDGAARLTIIANDAAGLVYLQWGAVVAGNLTVAGNTFNVGATGSGNVIQNILGETLVFKKWSGAAYEDIWSLNSANTMFVHKPLTAAGPVAIGLTTPEDTLHVHDAVNQKHRPLVLSGTWGASGDHYNVISFKATNALSSDIFTDTTGEGQKNFHLGLISNSGFFNTDRFSIVQAGVEHFTVQGYGTWVGNVGIGITAPLARLHLKSPTTGSIVGLFGTGTTAGDEFLIKMGNDPEFSHYGVKFGAVVGVSAPGVQAHAFIIKTNASTGDAHTERFRITSTGLVGIGISVPLDLLHVNSGNIRVSSGNYKIGADDVIDSNRYFWATRIYVGGTRGVPTADIQNNAVTSAKTTGTSGTFNISMLTSLTFTNGLLTGAT